LGDIRPRHYDNIRLKLLAACRRGTLRDCADHPFSRPARAAALASGQGVEDLSPDERLPALLHHDVRNWPVFAARAVPNFVVGALYGWFFDLF
jgi:hypothetical protein